MDILITIVAKVAEYAVEPIGRQIGYLFLYNRNIKDLEDKLNDLRAVRTKVQRKVNAADSNANEIHVEVSTWIAEVEAELPQENEGGVSNREGSNPSCFNLVQRHQISRKTNKRVKLILELIEKGNKFDKVGDRAPLPVTKTSILSEDYQILESRTLIAKQIKDALADPNVNKVGVHGMGGVGKTKLLEEVKMLVLEHKLFDRVIEVTVGQSNGEIEIQEQIGNKLNIDLPQSKEGRASFLLNKLAKMEDNILIMLDDLWKEYDLIKEVGIPCRSRLSKEGCKILMTSRFRDRLINNMNAEKCFQVNPLSEEESWMLFMKIIMVDKFDTNRMEHIAKEVVKKCGGLPIALKIIAKALKGRSLAIWKDALKQLQNPISVNIEGVSDQVYSLLKLSYKWIKSEAQLLVLLCSVFPDDEEIFVGDLQRYAMGTRLLNGISTWEAAKNRVIELVDHLKSSSLLLESMLANNNNYVQMHDVVRDVAKYIALDEGKMSTFTYRYGQCEWQEKDRYESYNAIFIECNDDFRYLPHNLKSPKLELLILRFGWEFREEGLQNPYWFFKGMDELKVLDLRNMCFQPLWISLTHSLKNLRTLCMLSCKISDIDTIGQLTKLEILRIIDCPVLDQLPATMSQLTQLKMLEVSNCSNLEVIPANIISSMTELEELNLWKSFKRWGEEVWYKNKWIQNVELSELNCLPHLFNLRLEIPKVDFLSDDLSLETWKLEDFCISVGGEQMFGFETYDKYPTTLILKLESQIASIDGVLEILLQECEYLNIHDEVDFSNDIFKPNGNYGYPRLKCLKISENSSMSHLIGEMHYFSYFTSLESLTLTAMKSLENIVSIHALTVPFQKLQTINLRRCEQLKNLFSFSIFKGLSNLQEIEIDECGMMDEIVFGANEEATNEIVCSHLSSLQLYNVYQLTSFCTKESMIKKNSESFIPFFDNQVSFPELKDLSIIGGGENLEILWHNNGLIANSFGKLQTIYLHNCNKLRYVFPSNMMTSLGLLNKLYISCCVLLERIFEIEKPTLNRNDDAKVMSLRELSLSDLPNLKYVWDKDPDGFLTFSNLKKVDVTGCHQLKSLFPASFVKYLQQVRSLRAHGVHELFPEDTTSNLVFPEIFPSLRSLEMDCKLTVKGSFWRRSQFPKLKGLILIGSEDDNVINLPLEMSGALYSTEDLEMKNAYELVLVFGSSEERKNDNNNNNQSRRGNLKRLDLCNLPKLRQVWKEENQISTSFDCLERIDVMECESLKYLLPLSSSSSSSITFLNLNQINVEKCNGMVSLFSSSVAKRLVNLKFITISSCGGMTSMVASSEEENGEIVFKKLTYLKLKNLPRMVSFHCGKWPVKFPSLVELIIEECPEMDKLEYLRTGEGSEQLQDFPQVSFPGLKGSSMAQENNLVMMSRPNNRLTTNFFHKLREINIVHCNKLRYIFHLDVMSSLVFLNSLSVFNCELLERIFEVEKSRTFKEKDDAKVVPLGRLSLMSLPSLKYVWSKDPDGLVTFSNLKEVSVFECPQLKSLFPASFIKHMEKIESLCVADQINELFYEDESSKLVFLEIVLFPSLRDLTMSCKAFKRSFWFRLESSLELQRLTLIGSEDDDMIIFPLEMSQVLLNIDTFEMRNALELVQLFENYSHNQNGVNLKTLSLCDLPKLTHVWKDDDITQTTTISFDSLKSISLTRCENLKCLLPSSITFFNLNYVNVWNCNGMMNLFSSSVAKRLVNLDSITVSDCQGMTTCIVAGDQGEGEEEIMDEIVLNKLSYLNLKNLSKLVGFCSGKCRLTFPYLKNLDIERCCEMKTFSYGIINTPRLHSMFIEGTQFGVSPECSINVNVQTFFAQTNEEEDCANSII